MRRILYKGTQKFEITDKCETVGKGYIPKKFSDQFSAYSFLLQFTDDRHIAVFRDILGRQMMMSLNPSALRDHEIFEEIARLLAAGNMRIAIDEKSYLAEKFSNINDVILFIHKDMIKNEKGTDVAYIRDNLKVWQWDNLIPFKIQTDIIQAYWRWYEKVKGGGPWDHKKAIKGKYGEWFL
ncbi:hypothetical protein [Desulfonema magnum]|uniref:Uncharacterized protein n=1 Tax=Desulfonema magnum TaxID=45655 RepID=A0A975BI15_9BACT|nr:hypothetical protein [Desulfonema magnum]QTA85831.1 Uncharacterized protein dnm_018460 [Desulfonema magnum]